MTKMIDIDSDEFIEATKDIIRNVLRAELNDYVLDGSILPAKIRGQRLDGSQALGGDSLQYDDTNELTRFAP